MGVKERKERERNTRARTIMDAASKVFFQRGYTRATIEEIASSAELSVGTIYLYFKNKEELYISLIFEGMEMFASRFKKILESDASTHDKVHLAWDFFMEFYEHNPATYHILNHLGDISLMSSLSGETMEQIIAATRLNFNLVSRILDPCIKQGIYINAPPRDIADAMWAQFLGMIQLYETRLNLGLKTPTLKQLHSQHFKWLEQGLLKSKE